MNDYQATHVRRQVMRALRMLGAKTYDVIRTEKDLNGMPTGEINLIGRAYGIPYSRRSRSSALMIDIPGVIVKSTDAPRFLGVMLSGVMPAAGDALTLPDGTSLRCVDCQESVGVLDLVLAEGEA